MSENKFIAKLKGEPTPKSVVEIQNDRLVAPFKSSPMGHIADRDSSVVVAKGAQNWAVNQGQLVPVADDYIGTESDLSGTSRVSGAGLWLNATYTFPATGDETNPVSAIIAPSAKWVLTLCGDSLITQNGSVITLTMLVKIGATHLTTKQFKVRECASQFSQRLAIDFSESEQSVIKAHGGSPLTVQVLCDDEGASATIYSGMTHLTLLQRKIDADLVATDNVLLPEFIENLLEGYIIPADYFSRYDYIEQVEDGGKAMPEFTRNGDDMTFSGWAKPVTEVYTKTEIDNKFTVANAQIDANATAIVKTRDDMNAEDSRLQTQITAQAAEIATKQDQLVAGDNIVISGNTISATGTGGVGFDMQVVNQLPATGEKGVIYLVPKDGTAPDVHDEYVWITATQTFELIGTTQVDLTEYVKFTDYAVGGKAGVIKVSAAYGFGLAASNGYLTGINRTLEQYNSAQTTTVISKGALENIKNDLVKRAVTENDITLTDEEKTAARTWISAVGNTDYATADKGGVVKITGNHGLAVYQGMLLGSTKTLNSYNASAINLVMSKGTLENIKDDYVKRGITANTIELTDEEKAAAQAWLGVSGGGGDYATVEYVDTEVAAVLDYAGDVDTRLSNANRNITQLNTNLNTVAEWVRGPKDEDGNRAELETEAQNAYAAINELNAKIGEGGGASLPILLPFWSDHVINDMSWLRADTFSWQSGDVYVAAYEHLVADYENAESETLYAWHNGVGVYVYTLSESPSVGDSVYDSSGILFSSSDYVVEVADGGIYIGENEKESLLFTRDSSRDTKLPQTDTIGDITIAYYKAEDGHKICTPDQESNVVALYEKTGVAWYFILDTENKQFKLPRTKYGFTGLRDSVGGYVAPGLPNIEGDSGIVTTTGVPTGAFSRDGAKSKTWKTDSGNTYAGTTFDASRSNSIYGASDTVQPAATQMYLYFYVGNFEQTAVEQTAGLNAELFNGKADANLGNIPTNYDYVVESQLPTADNSYTWYRKYKSGWVEQGGKMYQVSSITFPVPFAAVPTLSVTDINGDTAAVSNNMISSVSTTSFSGVRIGTNKDWTGSFGHMIGYWMAFGMVA